MLTQEQFDTALNGIRSQGGPSSDTNGRCLYRNPNGRKCVIGWLIDDSKYDPNYEGRSASGVFEGRSASGVFDVFWRSDEGQQLDDLQACHDDATNDIEFFPEFERRMKAFADKYGFHYSPIAALSPAQTEETR